MNAKPLPSAAARTAPAIQRGAMPRESWIGPLAALRAALTGQAPAPHAPWRASAARDAALPVEAWQHAARQRRQWLMWWVLGITAVACGLMWRSHGGGVPSALQVAQMALFALLFAWVSAGCVTAVMGFMVVLRGDRHAMSASSAAHVPLGPQARTALIMPICHEDVATVFGGLRATCESLMATGAHRLFEVFVLSDSSDPAVREAELAAWRQLRRDLATQGALPAGGELRVHYRCRKVRSRRKAGNVADFCRRWGRSFRYMVVLDADSVMTGESLVTLARLMEAHPRAGIIQTAPRGCGLETVHARSQQFASQVTGRLFTLGMQYWQLGEAHYWGHNAIIRIEPFMKHCGLAALPEDGALGGDILSHDFVEAALMRRAGWQVWLAADVAGSYEQQPPHLLAELQRDRRWCQGNLQNARLIAEPGLHGVHRAMLATGAMAYLSAPLWLLYVGLGALVWLVEGRTLAEAAGLWSLQAMAGLWTATAAMLMLPRLLGVAAVLWRGEQALHGGAARLAGSAVLEAVLSMLQAPLRMAAHTLFVVAALTGWTLEWKSPPREARDLSWGEAAARFAPLSAAALLVQAAAVLLSPGASAWLLPMSVPLLLAVPIAVYSSRQRMGMRLKHARWLVIAEEARVPSVLRRAWQLTTQYTAQLTAQRPLAVQADGAQDTPLRMAA